MSYFGKEFTEVYESLGDLRRRVRIDTDLANKRLEQIRSELTPVEYYVLKMRIRQKPISMPKIAGLLVDIKVKDKQYTRQNIERIIKSTLQRLNDGGKCERASEEWAEFGEPDNFILPFDDEEII